MVQGQSVFVVELITPDCHRKNFMIHKLRNRTNKAARLPQTWLTSQCCRDGRKYASAPGSSEANSRVDPVTHCRNFVRKHDYESFLTSQGYPRNLVGGYFALKAFSVRVLSHLR